MEEVGLGRAQGWGSQTGGIGGVSRYEQARDRAQIHLLQREWLDRLLPLRILISSLSCCLGGGWSRWPGRPPRRARRQGTEGPGLRAAG